jgi:hypothetical protein
LVRLVRAELLSNVGQCEARGQNSDLRGGAEGLRKLYEIPKVWLYASASVMNGLVKAMILLAGLLVAQAAAQMTEVFLTCHGHQETAVEPHLDDYNIQLPISESIVIDYTARRVGFRGGNFPLTDIDETALGFKQEAGRFGDTSFQTSVYGKINRVTGETSVAVRAYFLDANSELRPTMSTNLFLTCKPTQRMF